jgi:Arc/MetJ-type ribon-helix-helix transcriptional regulator
MSNEPNVNLVSITSRIDVVDCAKVFQLIDEGHFKDVSTIVRKAIHKFVEDVVINETYELWIEQKRVEAIERREKNRSRRGKRRNR